MISKLRIFSFYVDDQLDNYTLRCHETSTTSLPACISCENDATSWHRKWRIFSEFAQELWREIPEKNEKWKIYAYYKHINKHTNTCFTNQKPVRLEGMPLSTTPGWFQTFLNVGVVLASRTFPTDLPSWLKSKEFTLPPKIMEVENGSLQY